MNEKLQTNKIPQASSEPGGPVETADTDADPYAENIRDVAKGILDNYLALDERGQMLVRGMIRGVAEELEEREEAKQPLQKLASMVKDDNAWKYSDALHDAVVLMLNVASNGRKDYLKGGDFLTMDDEFDSSVEGLGLTQTELFHLYLVLTHAQDAVWGSIHRNDRYERKKQIEARIDSEARAAAKTNAEAPAPAPVADTRPAMQAGSPSETRPTLSGAKA